MQYDRHVRRTADDYADALAGLLPYGQAWPRGDDSVLMRAVRGLAGIFGFVDARAADLLERESDPYTTIEMMPEWERAFGLPDRCLAEPLSMDARRAALIARITMMGAQSREFFIALAAAIGYTIFITEFRPFMVGLDRVGEHRDFDTGEPTYFFGPPENRFYWIVHVAGARLTWFRVTSGQVGIDPHLRIGLATDLECLLRRYKPAHTEIIFDYSSLADNGSMAGTP
ncbi:YmfQ family protein [Bradyrhizobium ivorense]|uniref:YmfQ family protein n=1 Tax=Bradyrhizobium ivorense TaxID=2511166 RepID=UPI0010AF69E5|nr:putative phage tail protein [Bradyrhizobium ivorense]VIO80121.1 hypothetical protein CI41S_70810 [Bradyrhizobium ivorense]